ncbi:uncharacterized protein LOC142177527 [Nicotiana tabacum]|uniref:Uncharacterized protein LOC142177527 n=1 Tax=Nicotiana tabacum TaxID=4097 RepID=A0AC58TZJ2_TOBAC
MRRMGFNEVWIDIIFRHVSSNWYSCGCRKSLELLMEALTTYEKVLGQLVNKKKSCVVFAPNSSLDSIQRIKEITGMEHKEFPIKYLGCPLYVGWYAQFLSTGGRAILIRHVLLALPVHLLAAIYPHKGVLYQIERMLARFFWGNSEGKKRLHWASGDKLCMPYSEGGANFRKLQDICNAFTTKQWWNLRTSDSLWNNFLMIKYFQRSHPLIKQWYSGNSHSWNAVCKIKREVDTHILWKIGKGDIAFWFDNWTNLGPLCKFLP